jgi:hypothetical protein
MRTKCHPFLVLIFSLLCAASIVAQQKSYYIDSINSDLTVASGLCEVVVTETIAFTFNGPYNFVGRFIPNSISYGTVISNPTVSSSNVLVTNVYLKDDNGGTGKYIVWDFNGM